ncbi:MAG: MoaD/ThiS family protein [Acidimicrobiales bacterium]
MATVHLQADHARHTGGERILEVDGATVGAVIDELDRRFPGLGPLLREGASVAIDGELQPRGTLFAPVGPSAEVYFVAPITGG